MNDKANQIHYTPLTPLHFAQVVALGNRIQGDGYLCMSSLTAMYHKGWHDGINASWVALYDGKVVGFRLTFAHSQWQPNKWCTPSRWPVDPAKVCYFKCNTVDDAMQGYGIGSELLELSKQEAKRQGAEAGLAHIWLSSPGNSAFRYFDKNGGELVKIHPNKWRHESIYDAYDCPVCEGYCECDGAEMILVF